MTPLRPALVVIGPPGAGKSAVGKRVAREIALPFIDTDKRTVAKHGPIADIFAEHGEEYFRSIERLEVHEALTEHAVVALGGGAILHADTQQELTAMRVAYLTVSRAAVARRIRGSSRPLLKDGLGAWEAIANARREIYERLAVRTIDTSRRSPASIAHELAEWILREEITGCE